MCTQEEVREIIHAEVAPMWARRLLALVSMVSVLFIGWLAYEVHSQESITLTKLSEAKSITATNNRELSNKMDDIRFGYATANAGIIGRMDRLTDQMTHIKELAIALADDNYKTKQAEARAALVDERCRTVDRRIKAIEDKMKELFKSNT